jgi:hypothetical protein
MELRQILRYDLPVAKASKAMLLSLPASTITFGETVTCFAEFKNYGDYQSRPIQAKIFSEDGLLDIPLNSITIPSLFAHSSCTLSFNVVQNVSASFNNVLFKIAVFSQDGRLLGESKLANPSGEGPLGPDG